MEDVTRLNTLFEQADIEGMAFSRGCELFAGQAISYIKILKIFAVNIGGHLEELEKLNEEGLADYAVRVHGVKGSCYGIAAIREGDMAKELELAAKAGNYALVASKNAAFIEAVYTLRDKLLYFITLADDYLADGVSAATKPAPDREILQTLMDAVETYNIDEIRRAIDKLKSYKYDSGSELVELLDAKAATFDYEGIVEVIRELL